MIRLTGFDIFTLVIFVLIRWKTRSLCQTMPRWTGCWRRRDNTSWISANRSRKQAAMFCWYRNPYSGVKLPSHAVWIICISILLVWVKISLRKTPAGSVCWSKRAACTTVAIEMQWSTGHHVLHVQQSHGGCLNNEQLNCPLVGGKQPNHWMLECSVKRAA